VGQDGRLDAKRLASKVREFEDMGVDGVLVPDHMFVSPGEERDGLQGYVEPVTLLAAVGAISEKMVLGTIVSNFGIEEPALLCRRFAELAELYGGERVLLGMGAGWNAEEWRALGMKMPPHNERLGRLEEALAVARALFRDGVATLDGDYLKLQGFPMSPWPARPPRLMVGGGSDRLLGIAGRYADAVDLNGSSRRLAVGGPRPRDADMERRLTTTVADLERSVARVRAAAREVGRPDKLAFSVLISNVVFGGRQDLEAWTRGVTASTGIPEGSLLDCPYVLFGEVAAVTAALVERVERLSLDAIILNEGAALRQFCHNVLPALS
jgi:alkanesulfonate monooxygenase SsuD/methylene tetrahydromethanopterin reductase-like flavin-dependent oxidoreductase (luciferase family)